MDVFGGTLLGLIGIAALAAVVRPSTQRLPTLIAVTWWVAAGYLGSRFLTLDLSIAAVVDYSRSELPAWLRLAGTWAGPAGSLLFWMAIVITAVLLADRSPTSTRAAGAASLAAIVVTVATTNPFELDRTLPVDGSGLSPVLEHPAMAFHPPLLYLAHGLVLFAATRSMRRPSRGPVAVAAACLVLATLLGAWWAHDELGWGGWWAWDPVENTALAPLAALAAALHTAGTALRRWAVAAAGLTVLGVAAARSGLASSVHAFAPSPWPAIVLLVAGVALLWATTRVGEDHTAPQHRVPFLAEHVVAFAAGWVVVVVISGEIGAAWLGSRSRPAAIDGSLVARLLVPTGTAILVGLAVWGWRSRSAAAIVAHLGVAVFAVGVVASLGGWSERAVLDVGVGGEVHGEEVTVGELEVTDERPDLQRALVPVTLGGRRFEPSILRHLDLERTRSRPDRHSDWRGETEVVVTYVDGDRVALEARRHPGLGQVWVGGLLTVVGLLLGGRAQSSRARRRLAASNESMADASGVDDSDDAFTSVPSGAPFPDDRGGAGGDAGGGG